MIYIAGPFFNEEQVALIEAIEAVLTFNNMEFYSPRSEGVLFNMTPEEKHARMKYIFEKNVEMLNKCDTVVAVIDDHDTGTVWEIGYAYASKKPIVTVTDKDYGLNVMIAQCVVSHCKTVEQIPQAVKGSFQQDWVGDVI